jgi:hypothetical protein
MSLLKREAKEQRPSQTPTNNSTNLTFNPDRQTVAIESQKIILTGQESSGDRQATDHLYGLNSGIIQGMQKERSSQRPDNQPQLQRDFSAAAAKLNRSEFNSILETMVSKVSSQGGNELGPLLERVRQDVMRSYDRVIESRESTRYAPQQKLLMDEGVELASREPTHPVINPSSIPDFDRPQWLLALQPSSSMVPVEEAAQELGIVDRTVRRLIQKTNVPSELRSETVNVNLNVERLYVDLPKLKETYENLPKPGRPKKNI